MISLLAMMASFGAGFCAAWACGLLRQSEDYRKMHSRWAEMQERWMNSQSRLAALHDEINRIKSAVK